MSYQPATLSDDLSSLPQLPAWVTSMRAEALEDVAFLSEVALSHLHVVVESDALPHALLLDRLVLRAAEACVAFSGRGERAGGNCDVLNGFAVIADPPRSCGLQAPRIETGGKGQLRVKSDRCNKAQFNQEHHLYSRQNFKKNRAAALDEWRQICSE